MNEVAHEPGRYSSVGAATYAKRAQSLTAAIADYIGTPVEKDGDRTWRDVIAQKLVALAAEGSIAAMKLIFERLEGRVPQPIEHTGLDTAALVAGLEVQFRMIYGHVLTDGAVHTDDLGSANP